jgi:tellurite resistance protein
MLMTSSKVREEPMAHTHTLDQLKRTLDATAAAERPQLVEAIAATCLLVARADGEGSAPEIDRIAAAVGQLADPIAAERIEQQLAGDWRELQVGGLEALLVDLARRLDNPAHRRLALACAAAVAYADGHFDFEEQVLLERLAAAFGVSCDEAP